MGGGCASLAVTPSDPSYFGLSHVVPPPSAHLQAIIRRKWRPKKNQVRKPSPNILEIAVPRGRIHSRIARLADAYPTPSQLLLQPRVMLCQPTKLELGHGLFVRASGAAAAGQARGGSVREGHGERSEVVDLGRREDACRVEGCS